MKPSDADSSWSPRDRFIFMLVIGIAILLAVAMLFTFPAQDRAALAICEVIIVGLGFIIYGATMAVEKELTAVDDNLHVRRGLFRRRLVSLRVLNSIYLIGVCFGFFRAFVQPKRSWPALLWILAGGLIGATGIALAVLFG